MFTVTLVHYSENIYMCIYVADCDNNHNVSIIGAIVGVDCTVIIIMVITIIMVWIYCFRRRHHTGSYMYLLVNGIQLIIVVSIICICTQKPLLS